MSDLIIRGMEMPTERESFKLTIKYNGTVLDTETGIQVAEAYELPPHGRLVDADELFKDICNSLNEMTAIGIAVDGEWMWGKLNDALENAPTILPACEEVDDKYTDTAGNFHWCGTHSGEHTVRAGEDK